MAYHSAAPMNRTLDENGGRVLAAAATAVGVEMMHHARAESIVQRHDDHGQAWFDGLVCADGKVLAGDLLVLSCGVAARPRWPLSRGSRPRRACSSTGCRGRGPTRTSSPSATARTSRIPRRPTPTGVCREDRAGSSARAGGRPTGWRRCCRRGRRARARAVPARHPRARFLPSAVPAGCPRARPSPRVAPAGHPRARPSPRVAPAGHPRARPSPPAVPAGHPRARWHPPPLSPPSGPAWSC